MRLDSAAFSAGVAVVLTATLVLSGCVGSSPSQRDEAGAGSTQAEGSGDAGPSGEGKLFDVSWPVGTDAYEHAGYLPEGESVRASHFVSRFNLTEVSAVLTWSDGRNNTPVAPSRPDTFRLSVTAPGGETITVQGANADDDDDQSGTVAVRVDVGAVPEGPKAVEASDKANAMLEVMRARPPDDRGQGTWEFEVEMVDAGQVANPAEDLPCVDAGEAGMDCGNEWSLILVVAWYEARIESSASSGEGVCSQGSGNFLTVTQAPGAAVPRASAAYRLTDSDGNVYTGDSAAAGNDQFLYAWSGTTGDNIEAGDRFRITEEPTNDPWENNEQFDFEVAYQGDIVLSCPFTWTE